MRPPRSATEFERGMAWAAAIALGVGLAWASFAWFRGLLDSAPTTTGDLGPRVWRTLQFGLLLLVGLKVAALARWFLLVGATGDVPDRGPLGRRG